MWKPDVRADSGQASVELLALLPVIVLLAALAWQGLLAGHAWWAAASAARVAARAQALGHDPSMAARRALPAALTHGLRVHHDGRDGVRVTVRVPAVLGLRVHVGSVTARARMEPQA